MYQLQRGPMLGDVAGHADERAISHTSFLAASTPVALLMMAPALYVYSTPTAAFQQVPALDLAIQTGKSRLHTVCSYLPVHHSTSPSQQVLNHVKHEPGGRIQTSCNCCCGALSCTEQPEQSCCNSQGFVPSHHLCGHQSQFAHLY